MEISLEAMTFIDLIIMGWITNMRDIEATTSAVVASAA